MKNKREAGILVMVMKILKEMYVRESILINSEGCSLIPWMTENNELLFKMQDYTYTQDKEKTVPSVTIPCLTI